MSRSMSGWFALPRQGPKAPAIEGRLGPTEMQPSTKWGKRLLERQQKACAETETVWFPANGRVCGP